LVGWDSQDSDCRINMRIAPTLKNPKYVLLAGKLGGDSEFN
jgi:hypothetical protein